MQTLPSSFLRFAWLTHNSESCYGLAALEQAGERAAEHELKMAVEAEMATTATPTWWAVPTAAQRTAARWLA